MENRGRARCRSLWMLILFIVWLIVNIRVEAGMATAFERGLDGLVGGGVLLVSIFLALRFFGEKDGRWQGGKKEGR